MPTEQRFEDRDEHIVADIVETERISCRTLLASWTRFYLFGGNVDDGPGNGEEDGNYCGDESTDDVVAEGEDVNYWDTGGVPRIRRRGASEDNDGAADDDGPACAGGR